MDTFEISASVKDYFDPDKFHVRQALDDLCKDLSGNIAPEINSIANLLDYNRALHMAAQLRADYVEMLILIWDKVFGYASRQNPSLPRAKIDRQNYKPVDIWSDQRFLQELYLPAGAKGKSRAYELQVDIRDDDLSLIVCLYDGDEEGYIDLSGSPDEIGAGTNWRREEDDDSTYYQTQGVEMVEFLRNPDAHIGSLRAAACEMINYLARRP